jgi:hypothetical protein
MTFDSTGNSTFGSAAGDTVTLSTGTVTLDGAGTKTFNAIVTGTVALTQTDGTGAITFNENATVAGATLNENVTLSGMTFSSSALTTFGNAAGDTLTVATALVTLTGAGAYTVNSTVNSSTSTQIPLTLSGAGTKEFVSTIGATDRLLSLSQPNGSGTLTLRGNAFIGTDGASLLEDITFNLGLINQSFESAGPITLGNNVATDAINVNGAGTQTLTLRTTTAGTDGRIILTSTIASTQNIMVENADLFMTSEDADMAFTGNGSFTQSGGNCQLAGSIETIAQAITFTGNVYLFGMGTVALTATFGGNSTTNQITINGDLHIAARNNTLANKTLILNSPLRVTGSLVLYAGTIQFTAGTWTALNVGQDLVLLNGDTTSMYLDPDLGAAAGDLLAYDHPGRYSNTPLDLTDDTSAMPSVTFATTFPYGSPLFPTPSPTTIYSGAIDPVSLAGKTLLVGDNFYANGVNLASTAAWTLSISDNSNALTHFAEAYRLDVANCTVTSTTGLPTDFAWVSAAETLSYVTAPGTNTGWSFYRPRFRADNGFEFTGDVDSGTYTIYDNVIRVEFIDSNGAQTLIENSNNEIAAAVSRITYNNGSGVFTGAYANPECTTTISDNADHSYFYLQADTANRWNTDATGIDEGALTSTDRGRSTLDPATHRNVTPDISIAKATNAVFQTLRDQYKNRIEHYPTGSTFTATADRCRPVLTHVYSGQDLHVSDPINNDDNYLEWDAHNYFELVWSEDVTIGTAVPDNAWNVRSTNTFDTATETGGDISYTASTLNVSGYFTATSGAFELDMGVRVVTSVPGADGSSANALYRLFIPEGDATRTQANLDGGNMTDTNLVTNGYIQNERLRIYLVGYAANISGSSGTTGWKYFWPGYIDNIASPAGITIAASLNSFIRDNSAYENPVEADNSALIHANDLTTTPTIVAGAYGTANYDKRSVTIQDSSIGGWDITKPDIARYSVFDPDQWAASWVESTGFYEMAPVDIDADGFMDRIEMHLFDDKPLYAAGENQWVSRRGWYSDNTRPATPMEPAPDRRGGLRAASMLQNLSTLAMTVNAFTVGTTSISMTNANNEAFRTGVTDSLFNPTGPINILEDPYFTLDFTMTPWRSTDALVVSYNRNTGFLTDLAGIRMESFTARHCVDKTPPKLSFTIQPLGDDALYVAFSKPVGLDNLETSLRVLDGTGTNIVNPAINAVSTEAATEIADGYTKDAILGLTRPLTLAELTGLSLTPFPLNIVDPETGVTLFVSPISDAMGNRMVQGETHRVTDIGINVVEPLYASDGVNTDGTFGEGEGALRTFDGTGRLLDRDITVASAINPGTGTPTATGDTLQLFFDVKPSETTYPTVYNDWLSKSLKLWLPSILPSFNAEPNLAARALAPRTVLDANRNNRNFILSSNDDEVEMGSEIEFIFKYGDLYCARLLDENDITSVDPWRFDISGMKLQRGGVTILNNVIDANKGEKTILSVDLSKSGSLVIQVFTMDGNIVRTLERGKKGTGSYTYTWNGTNMAGNPVARGMYFIRVVGPDMDEIRKVMVVKE